ncbi:MAG: hypothetical protein JKY24_06170 [Pseudomonadales bacterium]|nr:hypothetical protein [Pseudomonadales bacterium]
MTGRKQTLIRSGLGLGVSLMLYAGSASAAGIIPPDCVLGASGVFEEDCIYFMEIPHKNYTRSYKLLVPEGFDPTEPSPLVVDFHGYGSAKSNQVSASCWKDKAREEGFIVAYPHGTGFPNSFSAGDYCCFSFAPARDDVQFPKDIVADVKSMLNIDASRVYATGLSNGGAVSHHLGCKATEVFTGVAPVSQTFAKRNWENCLGEGVESIPVVDFRAKDDGVIPYANSPLWISAALSAEKWANTLQCDVDPQSGEFITAPYGPVTSPYGQECVEFQGCTSSLVQCGLNDAGHVPYYTSATNVCDTAWDFFEAQP